MSRKFNKIDHIGTVAMLGLALLVVVKLAPTFLDQDNTTLAKDLQKQTKLESPIKDVQITEPNQVKLAHVTLPAPPPAMLQPTEISAPKTITKPLPPMVEAPQEITVLKSTETIEKATEPKTLKSLELEVVNKVEPKKFAALKETIVPKQLAEKVELEKPLKIDPVTKPLQVVSKKPSKPLEILEPEINEKDIERFSSTQQSIPEEKKVSTPKPSTSTGDSPAISAGNHNVKAMQTGRSLLKFLEHGKGPAIEIIWPDQASSRDRLYSHLTSCYGMVSAILTKAQFYKENQSGPWALNPDMFSGFLRQPTGNLPQVERAQISRIQSQNGLSRTSSAIRLFPRQSDAILLGGLQQLIGPEYLNARHIQGRYILSSNGLRLIDIIVDGRSIEGDIQFKPVVRNCAGVV